MTQETDPRHPEDPRAGDAAGNGPEPGRGQPDGPGPASVPDEPAEDAGDDDATLVPREMRMPPPRRTGVFLDPADLREHVGGLLRSMLGSYRVDAFGNFSFDHEGARIFVTVGASPMGPHVGIFSVTNVDLDLSRDLAAWLATTNHRLGFGTLSYDTDNRAVWLRHTLLGTALDAPELQAAVGSVASTAAALDDEISRRFGGRTFDKAPSSVRDATTPPTDGGNDASSVTGYL